MFFGIGHATGKMPWSEPQAQGTETRNGADAAAVVAFEASLKTFMLEVAQELDARAGSRVILE